ncbi:MAG TPA: protein kinase [Thermoanaerobaculia bacterium]|nr:protein kinase [Thermoanaerobaculia bacterium]
MGRYNPGVVTTGARLGPYEILTPLGAGGMGEVWRARDHRLHRDVAVKVLPEAMATTQSALVRFEREARAVAALSHPNILAIHDFGNDGGVVYAVMELLEGSTLRGRLADGLTVARALEWAHQIAAGLAAAHERGIVHRDLKPENLFITRDGVVKILDFGLARLEQEDLPKLAQESTLVRTMPGTVLGTAGYLSPEQARGVTADHRSDIFSFGAVFYEMLSGHPAFARATYADSLVAILREEPKSLVALGKSVPPEVEDILAHCLEKNRDERFRSAGDLAFALRLAIRGASASPAAAELPSRLTPRPDSGVRAGETSIAVLPFRNIGSTAETEYFTDGMTEEIINSISNIPTLHVAARTSSFAFRGRADDIRKVGRELGVAMVMEGSVRQVGSRLRVSAQLINVENGYQVWSDRWDRELADIFAVQDEIAQAIASTFKLRLVPSEGTGGSGKTDSVEAYDRYLKGRYLLSMRHTAEAIVEFQSAVDHDADFVDAHTSLADGWAIRGYYGGIPTWEAWARAGAAVAEAERIAPDFAGVALSRAILEHYYGWNTARQEEYCRLAIDRNPKSAEGWNWLGLCLASLGRTREALEATSRGIELEPYHANVRTSSAWAHVFTGDYETAERVVAKALELDPAAAYALWTRGIALRFLGRYAESIALLERLVESQRRLPFYVGLLGGTLAAAGQRVQAEEILDELRTAGARDNRVVASLDIAPVLSALGDDEAAIAALERARDERNALLWSRIYWPDYLRLRNHPRWKVLAQRLARSAPVVSPMRAR